MTVILVVMVFVVMWTCGVIIDRISGISENDVVMTIVKWPLMKQWWYW